MKNNFSLKFNIFDIFIASFSIILLVFILILTNVFLFNEKQSEKILNIYYQGEILEEYQVNLNEIKETTTIVLEKEKYPKLLGDMVIEIDPNLGVCVKEVVCPNYTCKKMGYTKMVGMPITCIPNGVYVMISSKNIDEDIMVG